MNLPRHIEIRPAVMSGKPCLKGNRIPAYLVLEKLAAGETSEKILAAFPQITKDQVMASLQYAASLASDEIVLAS